MKIELELPCMSRGACKRFTCGSCLATTSSIIIKPGYHWMLDLSPGARALRYKGCLQYDEPDAR
jgi:hypothetical protein